MVNGSDARKYQKNIKHVYLLSGTPWTVGFVDLFSQLKLLGYKTTWKDFEDRFIVYDDAWYGSRHNRPIKEYKNVETLYEILAQYTTFATTEAY